ncbi:MAG: hypothetical protein Ct9H300mP18_08070 [Candidatus Neomarinimicrobiota bacterium]|nr:MAG: hypothetical protein Ct9H300mP18_08070 [Candidatus Neomarinimicrobiota bacterium]
MMKFLKHNDVPQGLSSSIFPTNVGNAEKFLSREEVIGIANVNIGLLEQK